MKPSHLPGKVHEPWARHINDEPRNMLATFTQVDDGYPSDRILLKEAIGVITYLNDTRLVKNQPCPDLPTPAGLEHRRKLSDKVYEFEYMPGCNGAPGDLFVVRPLRQRLIMFITLSVTCCELEHVCLPGPLCPPPSRASANSKGAPVRDRVQIRETCLWQCSS